MDQLTLAVTKKEALLLLDLLGRAEEEMGNAGCNDYDIVRPSGFTTEERIAFMDKVKEQFPKDEVDYLRIQNDWFMLMYFTKLIRKAADAS